MAWSQATSESRHGALQFDQSIHLFAQATPPIQGSCISDLSMCCMVAASTGIIRGDVSLV